MTNMSAREVFLAAIRGEKTPRPAVATVDQSGTYEQMEALGAKWPDANKDPEAMARLALGAFSILGFDSVKVPFCQTIEQEALGCTVMMGDELNLPSIKGNPYGVDGKPVEELFFPEDFLTRGRVPVVVEAIKILKKDVGDKVAIQGGIIGPFSIASELVGIKKCLKYVLKNPEGFKPFMEVGTKAGILMAQALVEAGADVISIEDMMASVTMISPKNYRETVLSYETELISKIKAPTVLHICGRIDPIVRDMISTGVSAISFEPKTDINIVMQAVQECGRKVGIIGGIDAIDHLFYGKPEDVRAAALLAKEQGYTVVAPSCSIPPATPTANLRAMVEAVVS